MKNSPVQSVTRETVNVPKVDSVKTEAKETASTQATSPVIRTVSFIAFKHKVMSGLSSIIRFKGKESDIMRDVATLSLMVPVFEYLLSTFQFNVKNVYGVPRDSFLTLFCKLWNLSPSTSYKSTNKHNSTISVYGPVVDKFPARFDADREYNRIGLNGANVVALPNVKAWNLSRMNLIALMSQDSFASFTEGSNGVDVPVLSIEIPEVTAQVVTAFRKRVREKAIAELTAEVFQDSAIDRLTR